MKRFVCVSGSRGAGKTTLSVLLARWAEKQGIGRVGLVLADAVTPGIPVLFPGQDVSRSVSLGHMLTSGERRGEVLMRSFYARRSAPQLGISGYLAGESPLDYPALTRAMCESYFSLLEEYVDCIVVDATSHYGEILTQTALSMADEVILVSEATLPGASWRAGFRRASPRMDGSGKKTRWVLNDTDGTPVRAPDACPEARDGVLLPYEAALKEAMLQGRLADVTLSRTFRKKIGELGKAVFA